MKSKFHVLVFASILAVQLTFAQKVLSDDDIEEVVVTASFVDQNLSDLENPIHVIDGEDVSSSSTVSLGETIDSLVGVSIADYGAAIGQPIIRGMSGSRVKVLNNGLVTRDVSFLGPDHMNEVDLNNIEQIEIVRGPASLLYSNGSIGGIVNVVDTTIAKEDFEEMKFVVGAETQSVNDGDTQNFHYENNIGGINLSLSFKDSEFDVYDVPNGAVVHEEEHHDEDHDEEHGEEEHEDEHEENLGYIATAVLASEASRIGLSTTGDWGYAGVSFSNIESIYGIPFHGEGHEGHGGHDEDHDDEHGDEHGDEEEHEGERIFSTTDSERLDLRGSFNFNNSLIQSVDYYFRDSDYELTEQHAEEEEHHDDEHGEDEHEDEHEGHGHDEGPTLFTNDAQEAGFIVDLSQDTFSQKLVVNITDEDSAIIGHEAFMNPAQNEETTVGYYLSTDIASFHLDLGIRHDRINKKGSVSHMHEEEHHEDEHHDDDDHEDEHHEDEHHEEEMETDYFDMDHDTTSFALSIGRDLSDEIHFSFGLANMERAPSVVELFMNGPHLATGKYEVGNTSLDIEKSKNVDLTLSFEGDSTYAFASFYKNDVDNYIYLLDETEEEHEEHDEEHEEGHDDHGGLTLANYLQQDAEFQGFEFELGKTFELGSGELLLSFGRDSVSAKFSDGSNIPRINPARNIYTIAYSEEDLNLKLSLKDVDEQKDVGINESITGGYQMLDLKLAKTFDVGAESELLVSLFGNNLLDKAARNHSSFVKNEVPLPGRNFGVKFNFKY